MTHLRTLALFLGTVSIAGGAAADSWTLPDTTRVCSRDGRHCAIVIPKPIESQLRYFEDHVNGAENPGAGPQKPRTAKVTLQRRTEKGQYKIVAAFPLLNEVAPVTVLVSSKGDVVTFDNWHSVGYGDDVVVIYRNDGTIVKQYSLEELLSKQTVENLPHSVSSIWWGGAHYLDEKAGQVVLLVAIEGGEMHNAKYRTLRLDLATGAKVR